MKANELMVGDYVTFRDCLDNGEILSIKIMELHGYDTEFLASMGGDETLDTLDLEHEIVGIPLTPEILEKNTFESNKNLFGLCNYELSESYILENQGDRFCLSRIMAGHKYSTFWICDIHYVHELQHCLKLVGIEKEITL